MAILQSGLRYTWTKLNLRWSWYVNEHSLCLFVKETMRMLFDIPGTLSYVNETRRSLFEGRIYIFCQRDNENARWHTKTRVSWVLFKYKVSRSVVSPPTTFREAFGNVKAILRPPTPPGRSITLSGHWEVWLLIIIVRTQTHHYSEINHHQFT